MINWKPIKDAPKDGTRVLLYRSDWAENVCVGWYSKDYEGWVVAGSVSSPWVGPTLYAEINLPE